MSECASDAITMLANTAMNRDSALEQRALNYHATLESFVALKKGHTKLGTCIELASHLEDELLLNILCKLSTPPPEALRIIENKALYPEFIDDAKELLEQQGDMRETKRCGMRIAFRSAK
jgi:hypothetical protein